MARWLTVGGLVLVTIGLVLAVRLASDEPVVWTDEAPTRRAEAVRAAVILRDTLVTRNIYPHVESRCFGFELESANPDSFDFAARFNEERCGGDAPSNLLDRFRVIPATRIVLWYDVADDGRFKPLEARGGSRQ